MISKKIGENTYIFRLERNAEIMASLEEIGSLFEGVCKISAIGAGIDPELGFFNGSGYIWKEFEGEFEIISLEGSITRFEGKSIPHIHVVLGTETFSTIGGHLKKMIVNPTLEIFVEVFDEDVIRKHDSLTNLNLLDL